MFSVLLEFSEESFDHLIIEELPNSKFTVSIHQDYLIRIFPSVLLEDKDSIELKLLVFINSNVKKQAFDCGRDQERSESLGL